MTTYILHSLIWSLAGFGLGWVLGRLGRELREDTPMPQHSRRRFPRIVHPERILGVVVVVLAVLTMLTTMATISHLRDVTDCQARYNAQFRDSLDERTSSTARVREAQHAYVIALASSTELDSPQARDALERYRVAIDADTAARAAHPIPGTPNRCP